MSTLVERFTRSPRAIARWAAAGLLGAGLGIGLRMALFFLATRSMELVAVVAGALLALAPSADPVYTRAALGTLADVRVQGVAIAGPVGAVLHHLVPSLIVEPARAHGALIRLALQPGSAVLGRLVAAAAANAGVVAVGLLLLGIGLTRRRPRLAIVGVTVQLAVASSVVAEPPKLGDLELAGASFALNAVLPWLSHRRVAVSDLFTSVPAPLIAALLVALAVALAYLAGGVLAGALVVLRRWLSPSRRWLIGRTALLASAGTGLSLVLGCAAVTGAFQTFEAPAPPVAPAALTAPGPALPPQTDVWPAEPTSSTPPPVDAAHVASIALQSRDGWPAELRLAQEQQPSHVEIVGSNYHYQYLVNGQPEVIRGMGLNTQYAQIMTPEERAARLDADFADLRARGVNTVLGWDPAEFDETTMEVAQRHGLGVVVPFDLDPSLDYTDPAVRAGLTAQVRDWVARFKDEPALRMWGLGNEVLHKIVHPSWVGPQDPAREREARAFSAWLVETADMIHQLDPNHPVTYRDAEDAFTPWVAQALHDSGGGPRPWFAWGTNCYSDHLADVVNQWPGQGMDVPLWVSEFAPGGMAIPDRPDGFRQMWGYIRAHPDWVLGGAVYAWTRNGPEEIDRSLGLTDDGVPVDGRSLDVISELFHGSDPPTSEPAS